jgi:hypothetical protein
VPPQEGSLRSLAGELSTSYGIFNVTGRPNEPLKPPPTLAETLRDNAEARRAFLAEPSSRQLEMLETVPEFASIAKQLRASPEARKAFLAEPRATRAKMLGQIPGFDQWPPLDQGRAMATVAGVEAFPSVRFAYETQAKELEKAAEQFRSGTIPRVSSVLPRGTVTPEEAAKIPFTPPAAASKPSGRFSWPSAPANTAPHPTLMGEAIARGLTKAANIVRPAALTARQALEAGTDPGMTGIVPERVVELERRAERAVRGLPEIPIAGSGVMKPVSIAVALPIEVVRELVATWAGNATSLFGILSTPVSAIRAPALAAIKSTISSGNYARAAGMVARELKDISTLAVKTAGETATGLPLTGAPATVAGLTLTPGAKAAMKVAGDISERFPLPARWAQPLRELGAPSGVVPPPDAASLRQIGRELFGFRGIDLTPSLQRASFEAMSEIDRAAREAYEYIQKTSAKNLTDAQYERAADLVDRGILVRRLKMKPALDTPEVVKLARSVALDGKKAADRMVASGIPRAAVDKFYERYLPVVYLADEVPLQPARLTPRASRASVGTEASGRLAERGKGAPGRTPIGDIRVRGAVMRAQEGYLAAFAGFQQKVAQAGHVANKRLPGYVPLEAEEMSLIPALRGRYVPYADAVELHRFAQDAKWLADPSAFQGLLSTYKEMLTVWNPPTHTGNLIGNTLIADAHRVFPAWSFPAYASVALRELAKGGPEVLKADRAGLFGPSSLARGKVRTFIADAMAEVASKSRTPAQMALSGAAAIQKVGLARRAGRTMREWANEIYHGEDDLFRWLSWKALKRQGLDDRAAAMTAREWFGDPSKVPVLTRRIARNPLMVQPFISWQHAVMPSLMKAAVENPYAFARWGALLDLWNARRAESLGMNPDDLDRLKEFRAMAQPPGIARWWAQNMPMILSPFPPTASGDIQTHDITSFMPWGAAISGRLLTLGAPLTALYEATTGRSLIGHEVGPNIPSDQMPQEVARIFQWGSPAARESIKAALLSQATVVNGVPNWATRSLLALFRDFEVVPARGEPKKAGEVLRGLTGMRPQPMQLPQKLALGRSNMAEMLREVSPEVRRYVYTQLKLEEP